MYISQYWGNLIGCSAGSLNLVAFLADLKKEEISLSEIFAKTGLVRQNFDFSHTVEYLEFTHSNGDKIDFHFAIDVIADLAAIMLECCINGSVNLYDLDSYNAPSRHIRITATADEHKAMNKALSDFAKNPQKYDLCQMLTNDEIRLMAIDVEDIRADLYEKSGLISNYRIKAEDIKDLLKDYEVADGCLASHRITVEGFKVGYCYREKADDAWDSGWRFCAGDESDAYINDPGYLGIYKLNTICNYDTDIINLLQTTAPCAFLRDANGIFVQIKDEDGIDNKEP